jgi:signal transduction histidine kinase
MSQRRRICESLLGELRADAKASARDATHWLDVGEVLAEAHERHYAEAQRKGLTLRIQPSTAQVLASRLVLGRILDNLIGNALRYTSRGQVVLGVRRRAGGIEIQVIDTGPGLDLAQRHRLLGPLSQSGALPDEHLGHGLGLHIVHALCEQAGYRLTIRSQRGRGSSFGVLLPH